MVPDMSERAERLRAAERVCRATQRFLADWEIASILDDESAYSESRWEQKRISEMELNDAVDEWKKFYDGRT